jgi:hypothetical protein
VEEIQILSVVKETERGFHFAAAHSEPAFETVINDGPVERGMILAKLAQVTVEELRSDPELIGDAGGHIDPEFREGAAALTGVHGQPVVVVCVDKSLRHESVYFHLAVEKLKVLRLRRKSARAETRQGQSEDLPAHRVSLVFVRSSIGQNRRGLEGLRCDCAGKVGNWIAGRKQLLYCTFSADSR